MRLLAGSSKPLKPAGLTRWRQSLVVIRPVRPVVLLPKIALIYALHAVIMDHIYRTINLIAAFSASINPSCLMAPNRHRVTLSDPSGQVLARNALDSLETPHSLHSLRKSVCTAPSDRNQLSNGFATKGDGVVGSL